MSINMATLFVLAWVFAAHVNLQVLAGNHSLDETTYTSRMTRPSKSGVEHLSNKTTTEAVVTIRTFEDKSEKETSLSIPVPKAAEKLSKYKAAIMIETISAPAITVVGLVGNTLSCLVMFQKENRHVSCYFYMGMLAVTDSTYLIVSCIYWILKEVVDLSKLPFIHLWICKITWPIGAISAMSGTYIILAMTSDRLIAVKWPLKSLTWCTLKRARITTAALIIFCLIVKLPYGWISKPAPTCVAFQVERTTLIQTYYWANSALGSYAPFFILLILNLLIIHTMQKRGKYFQKDIYGPLQKLYSSVLIFIIYLLYHIIT